MPLFKTIKVSGGLIGVWHLIESSNDLTSNFSSEELLSTEFQNYTFEKRKREWLATRLLLKQLIGAGFTVLYTVTGKPILNHNKYKYLSISHSRYFVAVFVHEQFIVGIDIEDQTRNYTPIEKRYLSEKELISVNGNPKLQCLYWCAKEAIFKLVPDVGVEFREQIHISSFDPELDNQFTVRYTSKNRECTYQPNFLTFCNHGMVWVSESNTQLSETLNSE